MSKIEWCDETINPIIGCSKISPGCDNCYAEKMACRLAHMGNRDYQDVTAAPAGEGHKSFSDRNWFQFWNGQTLFRPSELEKPMHWKKPRKIFVTSMGDIFHESVSEWQQVDIFEMMRKAYWHTFFILTKRPENMLNFILKLKKLKGPDYIRWPLPHVFLGVTAENQEQADIRIPILLTIPANTHFVSIEPMLGPVDLSPWLPNFLDFSYTTDPTRLGWVICGGESGPKARPMHLEWARTLRDQCSESSTPFFLKQWGEWLPFGQHSGIKIGDGDNIFHAQAAIKPGYFCLNDDPMKSYRALPFKDNGQYTYRVGKKQAGRLLDGYTWNEFPNE